MKKSIILFSVVIGISVAAVSGLHGQTSLSLSPVELDFEITAGKSAHQTLNIGNDTFDTVRIQAGVQNWAIGEVGIDVFPAEGADGFSCREWITVEHPVFDLKSGDRGEVAVKVAVPASVEPGQYLAALSFNALPGDAAKDLSGVSVQGEMIALVFVTVGNPKAEAALTDLTVEKKEGRNILILRLKNSGRTFIDPSGEIVIRNAKGKKVCTLEIPEDKIPPLSERLLSIILEEPIPAGNYQAGCEVQIPSHKSLELEKAIIID